MDYGFRTVIFDECATRTRLVCSSSFLTAISLVYKILKVMADQQDSKKQPTPLSPGQEGHEEAAWIVAAKDELVVDLEFVKECHDDAAVSDIVASVVPQTTLHRNDRSLPGAFRILTTRQAQSAALQHASAANNQNEHNEALGESSGDVESSSCESAMMLATPLALDATVVATAVENNSGADAGVTEVFKAVPLEPTKAAKWPRSVYLVVCAALLVSAASLAAGFSMRRRSSLLSRDEEAETSDSNESHVVGPTDPINGTAVSSAAAEHAEVSTAVQDPHELFANYDRITSHMALIAVQVPQSCHFKNEVQGEEEEEVTIHVECGSSSDSGTTTDAVLFIDQELSLNVQRCDYNNSDDSRQRRSATCIIGKNRLAFSYVIYSCGFRGGGGSDHDGSAVMATSVAFVEVVARCSDSDLVPFDISDTPQSLLTGLALGGLCRDPIDGRLEYVSVPTECPTDDTNDVVGNNNNNTTQFLLSYETDSTNACIDLRKEDECIPDDCDMGSYGIMVVPPGGAVRNSTVAGNSISNSTTMPSCAARSWNESIFGPSSIEATLDRIDSIAFDNRGFANVFAEDFSGG
jgi:hypothetical protein